MQNKYSKSYTKEELIEKVGLLRNIDPNWIINNDDDLPISKVISICLKNWNCDETILFSGGVAKNKKDRIIKLSAIAAVVLYSNNSNRIISNYFGIQDRVTSSALDIILRTVHCSGDLGEIIRDIFWDIHLLCPSKIDNMLDDDLVMDGHDFLNGNTQPKYLATMSLKWFEEMAANNKDLMVYRLRKPSFCKRITPSDAACKKLHCLQGIGYRFCVYAPFPVKQELTNHSFIRGTYYMTTACLTCTHLGRCRFESPDMETLREYPDGCPCLNSSRRSSVLNITKRDIGGIPKELVNEALDLIICAKTMYS